ncbi:MAG: MFS transporter [Planctomycetales bacterium]|nr:MFS transporter [Planctomycetales bacterium]
MLLPAVQLRRNMAASTADAAAYGVMVGVGETFLPAFALAVGLGEVTAGIIASVPLMAGGLLQLISLWVLARGFPEKWWVVLSAALQGLTFVPLVLSAYWGTITGPMLLLIASLYWAAGLATGPAWNSWIEKLIPRGMRTNYFAKRTRASQFATLLGFVAGGLLLQYGRQSGWVLLAFAALFSTALLSRLASAVMLALHRDPGRATRNWVRSEMTSTASSPGSRYSGKHLLIYLVLVQGMVQLSGPYFTPYMLTHLQLSYLAFTGLIAVAFIAKVISLAAWGQLARQRGAGWLLTVGGTAIVPLSALWIVAPNYYALLAIQVVTGIAWAAYELGLFLMFFEALPLNRRVLMLTYYNLANTSAWCVGATIGALLLSLLGTSVETYYLLFALSSGGRLLAVCYLFATRPELKVRVRSIGFRVVGIRPNGMPLETPILPSVPEPQELVTN